jgi:hypothetical protein
VAAVAAAAIEAAIEGAIEVAAIEVAAEWARAAAEASCAAAGASSGPACDGSCRWPASPCTASRSSPLSWKGPSQYVRDHGEYLGGSPRAPPRSVLL